MNDTLELNVESQDLELNKDKLQNQKDSSNQMQSTIEIMPKSMRKRIVYDLSDNEKAKHNFKAKNSGKSSGNRAHKIKKGIGLRANGLNSHDSVQTTFKGKRETFKISTVADLRESLKNKQFIDRQSRIESQVKIEYVREPQAGIKSNDLHGSGDVKEELKRDILNLKSKLEGVEAKVNNNYFPSETITKIECHSNYQLHMKEHDNRVKSHLDARVQEKLSPDNAKSNLRNRIGGDYIQNCTESEERIQKKDKLPLRTSEKSKILSRLSHSDKHNKLRSYQRRLRDRLNGKKISEKRRDSELKRKTNLKSRSRFPSGDLDKLRSKRAEKNKSKKSCETGKKNRSLSPNSKGFRNSVFDHINRAADRLRSHRSDPSNSSEQKEPWLQFKTSTEKSIAYDSEVTLSQDAFGLHPNVLPKSSGHEKDAPTLRNGARSITPIFDSKRLESTPVLFQSPLFNQREHSFSSTRFDNSRGGKGIDWKIANNLKGNEVLRYIENCSTDYVKQLDRSFPDLRRVIGHIVNTVVPKNNMTRDRYNKATEVLPCDVYNQSDACPYSMLHLDSEENQRIHSCSLCYFSLKGLINLHRQTRCPLLNIIKN